MRLECYHCDKEVHIVVRPSGPHLRADCSQCGKYIKFLSREERSRLEAEEDAKEVTDG